MHVLQGDFISFLLFSFVAIVVSSPITALGAIEVGPNAVDKKNARSLWAARPKSAIKSRSLHNCLAPNVDLHYINENALGQDAQFTARVQMTPKFPSILLEEIEHHLEDIVCSHRSIKLDFVDPESMEIACDELDAAKDFYIITSHDGCNKDGERSAYRVSKVQCIESQSSIILSTTYSAWKDAVSSITIDFGHSPESFEPRAGGELHRRQAATATSPASSISFPFPPAGAPTPTASSVSQPFFDAMSNMQILPWLGPSGVVGVSGPSPDGQIEVSCKSCSVGGSLALVGGSFTADVTNPSKNSTDNIVSFYSHGYVEMEMRELNAYFSLETKIQPHSSLTVYEANLPPLLIPGFEIPGIGIAGPILRSSLSMGAQLANELDFDYGLHLQVPQTTVQLAIGNVTNSSINGFENINFIALPFQSNVGSVEFNMSMGYHPQIFLGISLFDGAGELGVAAEFNLSQSSVAITQVKNVNSMCEPASSSNTTDGDIFDSLTNVVASWDIDANLISYADLQIGDFAVNESKAWTPVSVALPAPTQCLKFDSTVSTYGPPNPTSSGSATTATAVPTATGPPTLASTTAATGTPTPTGAATSLTGVTLLGSFTVAFLTCVSTFLF